MNPITINHAKLSAPNLPFSSQNKQFWTLQLFGWSGYALMVFFSIIHPQLDDPNFNFTGQLWNLLVETLSGFCLSYIQWQVIGKTVHWPLRKTLTASFASAAVLGLLFNVIKLASYKTIVYGQVWYQQLNMLEFGGWFLFSVSTMFVWTAIFFIMLYNTRLQREHEMLLRAQTAAKEAQLQMLRYQLNPHFMFNTMNAISTLIFKKDNDKAGEMLDKLCTFFRHSLQQDASIASTLSKELSLLELYLSIEKVRFTDRLRVGFDIEPQTKEAKVPALVLQPVVENAIKYAVEQRKVATNITITAKHSNDQLILMVCNDKDQHAQLSPSGFGIGLNNTKERMLTMFNQDCDLEIVHHDTQTSVTLIMPFVIGA
ncbi:sensor histidine kinase (plasmid) [Pseudoalteromonas sp. T1lg65]|uniref:sensor histidine kinase n=1 Tax=Pseudoalteromonas sp. T1lg65 TaxID=2077101 RepID=UPI003F793445